MKAFLLILALATAVRAQPEPRVEAKRISDFGADALRRGDYAVALDYFQRAYAIFPSVKLRYNMALALGGIGRYSEAIEAFEEFLSQGADAPANAREYAQQRLRELLARVGQLEVAVSPPDAALQLDGGPLLPRPGHPLRVTVGDHQLAAQKSGYQSITLQLSIVSGETRRVEVALNPEAKPPPATPAAVPVERPKRAKSRWWIWTGAAVVVVGVALGVGLGFGLSPQRSTFAQSATLPDFKLGGNN